MNGLIEGVPLRALVALGALALVLLAAPLFASDYVISVLIIVLYFAFVGQAWNLMLGFAGMLSLGHALFVGVGAYTSAALFIHFHIGPWASVVAAIAASVLIVLALLGAPLFAVIAAGALWAFYQTGDDLATVAIEFYRLAEMPMLVATTR